MEIITVRIGDPDYERHLGPVLDQPEPEIKADAEIDMRREAQTDPDKLWWLAIEGEVLAFCARWRAELTGAFERRWQQKYRPVHRPNGERIPEYLVYSVRCERPA